MEFMKLIHSIKVGSYIYADTFPLLLKFKEETTNYMLTQDETFWNMQNTMDIKEAHGSKKHNINAQQKEQYTMPWTSTAQYKCAATMSHKEVHGSKAQYKCTVSESRGKQLP
jgi:hypothetical protein